LGHPWDTLGQLGIEKGELRIEVLKIQPFTVHLSLFPEIDCPNAILDFRFWILDSKPKPKA
jgi:hypothetical protein